MGLRLTVGLRLWEGEALSEGLKEGVCGAAGGKSKQRIRAGRSMIGFFCW